ncbi:glycosyltransferase [Methylobacterium sp. Leaf89]|uniref:glycosyltransferase n=1 Tax=Methylobacterium sp. Leaf89 TaxID=1736245 RepID=UPI0009EA3645|nr:glycosyltransferase [Methylobacterium sp. Leaf89]
MTKPVVHLYTVCWDEADMLGFFFRHYDSFVDRYVVYDDGSTDGSSEILAAHPKVELRAFTRVEAGSFVLSHKAMQDEAWKQSRGVADWVVVTAIDEHLHVRGRAMAEYLAEQAALGVTLIPALGFDMNHSEMPADHGLLVDRVTRGRPRIAFNKLSVFRPEAVLESGFGPGRHAAEPQGDLRLPARDVLMLWHYKHLGFARNAAREAAQAERLGAIDRAKGYGQHYLWGETRLRTFWDEMEREACDLSAKGFDPAAEAVQPLWWEERSDIVRAPAQYRPPAQAARSAPAVSVLIKSYNHAPYVAQTIQSVLDQSFQDFEIVVTDDASTDATAEIVAGFADPRIRLEILPHNHGISGAMNATITRARGHYLAILNSDDWALPGRLARQVAFLDGNPAVSAVFGMPRTVDEAGTLTVPFNDFRAPLRLSDFSRRSWLRQFFFHGNCLCAPTAMIRRSAYEAVGAYDPRLTNYQDLDMWIRMLAAGQDLHVLDEELTAFRIRAGDANMSAPRTDTHLRSAFEITKLLRHYANFDRSTFEEVFGPNSSHDDGEVFHYDMPIPLRVADLASRIPRVEYQHFALEILYQSAERQEDFDRLRNRSGEIDAFGLRAITDRDREIHDLSIRTGIGFTYPASRTDCRSLEEPTFLYRVVLGRNPDDSGLRNFRNQLSEGRSLRSVAQNFIHSDEFKSLKGKSDGTALLCWQAVRRPPNAQERDLPLADLAVALVQSPETASRHSVLSAVYPDGVPVNAPHLYAWWNNERERLSSLMTELSDAVASASLSVIMLIDRPLDLNEQNILVKMAQDFAAYGQLVLAPIDIFSSLCCRKICNESAGKPVSMVNAWWPRSPEEAISQAQGRCQGTFTCIINRGDSIATKRVAELLPLLSQADVLLCDEDVRTLGGQLRDPALNGRWDPDACLSRPPSALILFRTSLIRGGEGWRGPSEEKHACRLLQWDLLLRISHHRRDARIQNAPIVMVHREEMPKHAQSPSSSILETIAGRFLRESSQASTVKAIRSSPGVLRLHYQHPNTPKASIIVPTRDRVDLLRPCVESILSRTQYPNFEVLVVDNESCEPASHSFLREAASDSRFRSISCGGVFNWARSNNVGADQTDGEILIFLNNDTVIINKDWLDELVSQSLRPEVGVSGAKLYFPDDKVQHAGIEVRPDGAARHVWRGALREDFGYLDQLRIVRNVSAVTGACMALRRSVFRELSGFNEKLRVAWNDIDFCIRAIKNGYRIIWTPHSELYHYEGATRAFDQSPQDEARHVSEREHVLREHRSILSDIGFQNPNIITDRDLPYLSTSALRTLAMSDKAPPISN